MSGGGGNRTGTDSGIASTVGSVSIGQKSSAPNSPFVPGTLRPLAEEKLSKVWPSSPGVSHINKGAMIPHLASSNSMLQKTVAANMPSTLSARSLQQGQGVGSTSNQPGITAKCTPFSFHKISILTLKQLHRTVVISPQSLVEAAISAVRICLQKL